jgi:glycosyltransferase involved in cell wall biosynthesis
VTERLLVVSPVHPADDPRIRHKLIATLAGEWDVTFASRRPGPVDRTGIHWDELTGPRLVRDLRTALRLLGGRYDVASVHDPEVLPVAILAGMLGRTVVFDVHENIPAQLRTKSRLPRPLRRPLGSLAAGLLHLAERVIPLTLAEPGYQALFKRAHPIFPNYLMPMEAAPVAADPSIGVVYLGDITPERGIEDAVRAAAAGGIPRMTLIGRCAPDFRARLEALAAASGGCQITFTGFLPPGAALPIVAAAELGISPLRDLPNYRDSLPTKVLEYLALGVPVVASDLPGTRRVIGDQPGVLLVTPGDIAVWARALRDTRDDGELRSRAGAASRQVRDSYAWPADAVRRFYAGLVAP